MSSSARLSIVAIGCYSFYAFASVPILNSAPTALGPLMRIAVFSSCAALAYVLQAGESFRFRQGLIGSAVPVFLVALATMLWPRLLTVPPLSQSVVGLCSFAVYAFICGMFAAVPKSVNGAVFFSGVVLVVQLLADLFLIGAGAYGLTHHSFT